MVFETPHSVNYLDVALLTQLHPTPPTCVSSTVCYHERKQLCCCFYSFVFCSYIHFVHSFIKLLEKAQPVFYLQASKWPQQTFKSPLFTKAHAGVLSLLWVGEQAEPWLGVRALGSPLVGTRV